MDYGSFNVDPTRARAEWAHLVPEVLVGPWAAAYAGMTPWVPEIVEVELGDLFYIFDIAPTRNEGDAGGEDRVVVVWGHSSPPAADRDRARTAGFIPVPASWSARARDRGHLVAHAVGGGLDLNLIPQRVDLNRGRSSEGRRWRALEREAAANPGTPLFVRPIYRDTSWVPSELEYGLLRPEGLLVERFRNDP